MATRRIITTPIQQTYTGTQASTPTAPKASNLNQYYSGKGSKLGTSVQARFSDPNFSNAAQRAGISQNDYAINQGNASYNQRILAELQGGSQPQAPQQPMTAPQQTLGDAFGTQETQSPYKRFSYDVGDNPYAELGSMFKQEANQKVDENKIRRETLARFRDQMSGTDQAYNQMYQEAQQRGKGDVGSGTALLAARGLAGSQRGEAIAQGVEQANSQRENAILAAKAAALENIANMAEQQAQQLISGKQAARQQGYSNYVDYLAKESTINENNRKNILQALLSQGIDPSEIDPNEFNKIASKVRTTGDILKGEYASMKAAQEAAEAKALQEGAFNLSEGQARYDAEGNLIASRAKTYKGGGGGNSSGAQKALSAISGTTGGNLDTGSLQDAIAFLSPGMAKNERQAFNSSVDRFLKSGNTKAVEELIFKTAVNQLPDAGTKSNVTKKRAIYNQVGELSQALDDFYAAGGSTDIISGKKQSINNKLGKVADPELRRIGQRVTFLVDELGKAQSGAALNANEEALYKSLFPSAGKTAALNTTDVQALQEALRGSVENTIGVALGSSGVQQVSGSVFGDKPKTATVSGGGYKSKSGKSYVLPY